MAWKNTQYTPESHEWRESRLLFGLNQTHECKGAFQSAGLRGRLPIAFQRCARPRPGVQSRPGRRRRTQARVQK